ncbi:ArsR/SmtB family transcription factor [Streptomyces beigongshangae]|uniref:ArsR/SmtB family transcription factor n=1 Tax=Streptomyces beigongshangae TaxID=2841597 RepID=UPI001C860DC6|nr:helix-turn-helix domain-containing protein [Streptomyces sp. REN17]
MLRIHFSAEDLGRIRLATGPDPAWEALLSLHVLGSRDTDADLRAWRTRVRTSVDASSRALLTLAPPRGYSPDFLTPAEGTTDTTDPEASAEAVASTSAVRLRADLEALARQQKLPSWADALASGRPAARRGLGTALRRYHRQALSPYWPQITATVDADLSLRTRSFLAGGAEQILRGLHPAVRWRAPVLQLPYPRDQDMYLHGRGLRLVPSYFCRGGPITLRDPSLPPVLVYPASRGVGSLQPGNPVTGADALDRLLGRTRAATLAAIAGTQHATGREIARRLGISQASASEHASVLRDAGLIHSLRVRNTVRHVLTPLGAGLLEGRTAPHAVVEPRTAQEGAR